MCFWVGKQIAEKSLIIVYFGGFKIVVVLLKIDQITRCAFVLAFCNKKCISIKNI